MIRIENKKTTELSKSDLEQILNGFNEVFSLERPFKVMINQYTQNPFGYSFHNIVYDDEKVIGHTAGVPSLYWFNGDKQVIVDSVDTFILKRYRDGQIFIDHISSYFKGLKENKSQIVQIEHKEEIKEIIPEKNNDKNIIENYAPSVDKYENFSVSKIKELKNFTTKNEINKLLVLNDGRVLTTQMYYDEKGDTFYKLCVYSLNNGFVCDINIDFYDVREIYLMDDGNILINNHDENPIKVIKILDNKIEEVWKFDKLDSIEKKLSKDKILISTKKKRDKPYFNEFFQVYVDFKWENEIFTYDKGQLVFYKNIHKFYRDIKAKNMIQINDNEYIFYAKQKGKIYGENDFLIFYDIQTGNVLKKLKVGKGENGTEMLLLNKDILLIQGNETVILIDIKNRKISKEYKLDFCFDLSEVVFLNEKTFLHHCVIKKQPDKLLQYEIKDLKTLELKEEKVIDLKTYFIYSKYPGNKLIISDCKNLLSIYG